jgi:hypothetical protein
VALQALGIWLLQVAVQVVQPEEMMDLVVAVPAVFLQAHLALVHLHTQSRLEMVERLQVQALQTITLRTSMVETQLFQEHLW